MGAISIGKIVYGLFVVYLVAVIGSGGAGAIPLKWTVEAVGETPSAKITGSFIYDEDTDTYTDIAIVTAGVDGYEGLFDQLANQLAFNVPVLGGLFRGLVAVPSSFGVGLGSPVVRLVFGQPTLSNAGCTIPITTQFGGGVGTCLSATCGVSGTSDSISSGSATASPVPVPGAFVLLASAIAGTAAVLRRRRTVD